MSFLWDEMGRNSRLWDEMSYWDEMVQGQKCSGTKCAVTKKSVISTLWNIKIYAGPISNRTCFSSGRTSKSHYKSHVN